ncbi:MAG: hypothetical protein LBP37_02365 [Spirochaetaceae bacterium]|jgi:hypothetical protein|nr:hypothetical protein [Spirochaetaceae bacterium]
MSEDRPLTFFYRLYEAKGINARELETKLFKHFMNSFDYRYGLYFGSKDEKIDFLCWFYPIMRRAIERYNDVKSSFDAYMASMIRFSYQDYRDRKRRRVAEENNYYKTAESEAAVCDPEADYEKKEMLSGNYQIGEPNYILLVLLKSYYYVSDELLSKAAPVIGIEPEILGKMVDTLRCLQFKKIERLQKLIRYTHCLYYRCIKYEGLLAEKAENWPLRNVFSRRLEHGRQRLFTMRERLKSTRIEATNNDLAKVLGVPKGTIDSRWTLIKSKLAQNSLSL